MLAGGGDAGLRFQKPPHFLVGHAHARIHFAGEQRLQADVGLHPFVKLLVRHSKALQRDAPQGEFAAEALAHAGEFRVQRAFGRLHAEAVGELHLQSAVNEIVQRFPPQPRRIGGGLVAFPDPGEGAPGFPFHFPTGDDIVVHNRDDGVHAPTPTHPVGSRLRAGGVDGECEQRRRRANGGGHNRNAGENSHGGIIPQIPFRRKGLLYYCHRGIADGDIRDLRRQAVSEWSRWRANPAGAGGRGYFHSAGAE